ncbi:TcmI family type II polyketide cyclase [Micromonospora ureilytica]|uniref:TcmI family type II polyketide cyclase n=1 Tax=Micromonospora ureilytica TaxID=709868 RepID=UPI002E14E182|nr:TcmI family type II polyketide cyclase [Micromonospora ureilytica]
MSRLLTVSRIIPGAQGRVAQIFAESDASGLPTLAGTRHRSLYCLHDLLLHLTETADVSTDDLVHVDSHLLYQQVNERLSAHISPFLPIWGAPRDAIAGCFYSWPAARPPRTGTTPRVPKPHEGRCSCRAGHLTS